MKLDHPLSVVSVVSIAVCGLVCSRQSETRIDAVDQPPVALTAAITPMHLELGDILPGSTQRLTFSLSAGQADYEVIDCHASCGCTKPVVNGTFIASGQSAETTVHFHAPAFVTSFRHSFQIQLRNKSTGEQKFAGAQFSGSTNWPVFASPPALALGKIEAGKPSAARIHLRGRFASQLQINSVAIWPETQGISVLPPKIPNTIELLIIPQIGPVHCTVRIDTNCPERPEIVVPVQAVGVSEENRISPATLSLGIVREGDQPVRTIIIHSAFRPVKISFDDNAKWRGRIVSATMSDSDTTMLVKVEFDPPDVAESLTVIANLISADGETLALPISMIGVAHSPRQRLAIPGL
jgi:hypothetical protein